MSAHLHQQGAGQPVLIILSAAQHRRAGQGDIVRHQLPLKPDRQGQIVLPPVVSRAHHQHDLSRPLPVLGGDKLVNGAVLSHQCIPMHIQGQFDRGILLQPPLHRRPGALIGAAVSGVVVQLRVVDHLKSIGAEHLGDLLSHPHHIVGAVCGAVGVALGVGLAVALDIGLAAVGVVDQDLGSLPQRKLYAPLAQHRRGQLQLGAIIKV